jgi:hypothetical protein
MVSAMLTPVKKHGRARASGSYDALKGVVVFTVRRLRATGISFPEASKMVASELAKQGIRPARKGSKHGSEQLSKRTLRKWQEDIGFNKTATDTLTQLESAHLKEVLESFGIPTLPTGSTTDDLLRQRFGAGDLQRAYLGRLAVYIANTRSEETT